MWQRRVPRRCRGTPGRSADLLIAVIQSDQTNLWASRIAKTLYNLPTRIARLRSADYVDHPELLDDANFAVDYSICPGQIVTDYVSKLIEFPEALQVLEFAGGQLSLGVRAVEGGIMVGHPPAQPATAHPKRGRAGGGHLSSGPGHRPHG